MGRGGRLPCLLAPESQRIARRNSSHPLRQPGPLHQPLLPRPVQSALVRFRALVLVGKPHDARHPGGLLDLGLLRAEIRIHRPCQCALTLSSAFCCAVPSWWWSCSPSGGCSCSIPCSTLCAFPPASRCTSRPATVRPPVPSTILPATGSCKCRSPPSSREVPPCRRCSTRPSAPMCRFFSRSSFRSSGPRLGPPPFPAAPRRSSWPEPLWSTSSPSAASF